MFEVKGKSKFNDWPVNEDASKLTVLIDEGYSPMGCHIERSLKEKIQAGDYIDLARLLPRDRVSTEDDHRLEIVNEWGMSYWVLISDRELTQINSYIKWEQAFRLYTGIFAKANPDRVSELLQYNHTIEVAASHFTWDCVYHYDKEFRLHMAENLGRNWGIILQQAWTLNMKVLINVVNQTTRDHLTDARGGPQQKKVCFQFNRGRCSFGSRCKFDHRCGICGKWGHGAYN